MTLSIHLTQELIADALGLTTVHVNRTLRQNKLIAVDGRSITIVDLEAMSLLSDFERSYLRQVGRLEQHSNECASFDKFAGHEMEKWSAGWRTLPNVTQRLPCLEAAARRTQGTPELHFAAAMKKAAGSIASGPTRAKNIIEMKLVLPVTARVQIKSGSVPHKCWETKRALIAKSLPRPALEHPKKVLTEPGNR
jgi:hypothetical protein